MIIQKSTFNEFSLPQIHNWGHTTLNKSFSTMSIIALSWQNTKALCCPTTLKIISNIISKVFRKCIQTKVKKVIAFWKWISTFIHKSYQNQASTRKNGEFFYGQSCFPESKICWIFQTIKTILTKDWSEMNVPL